MISFILDDLCDPAFNMAADQCLLKMCSENPGVYVRFYAWKTPSITIGYMQNPSELLNVTLLEERGITWIRRPTGGRAVLHYQDLTYSCIFPKTGHLMGSTVQQSYQIITRCLMDGLSRAGITCTSHDSYDQLLEVKREVKLPCFLAPNRDEIMVEGKKLIGSAQKRTSDGVLQHGSIPISDYYRHLPSFLNISEKEQRIQTRLLRTKSTCIRELTPTLSASTLIQSLKEGFISTLGLPWNERRWSSGEVTAITSLAKSDEFRSLWM